MVRYFDPVFVLKALILLAVSIFLIFKGGGMNRRSAESTHWPSTEGRVLSAQVGTEKHYSGPGGGSSTCYKADVDYEYQVQSATYRSNKISYYGSTCRGGGYGQKRAQELVRGYLENRSVEVFYNPQKPERSCLQPGRTNDGRVLVFFGGVGCILFLLYTGARALDRYAGLGEFCAIEGGSGEHYVESFCASISFHITAAAAMVLLIWFGLPLIVRFLVFPGSMTVRELPAYYVYLLAHPPFTILLAVALVTTITVFLRTRKTIRYSSSGILLPAKSRWNNIKILSSTVVSCSQQDYRYPFFSLLSRGPEKESLDVEVIRVAGYRGKGVLLEYVFQNDREPLPKKAAAVDGHYDTAPHRLIHFPCRDPLNLCRVLTGSSGE